MDFFWARWDGSLKSETPAHTGHWINPNCDIEETIHSLTMSEGEIKPRGPVGGGTVCFINACKALLWSPGGLGSVVIKLGLNLRYSSPCL